MKLKLLSGLLALQVAWIVGTSAVQEVRLRHAPTILLETVPVDPRDLLRGDYVILNYAISMLSPDLFQWPRREPSPAGQAVYVLLERRGEYFEAVRADFDALTPAEGQVMLRGILQSNWAGSGDVVYGIERYYVPEGQGNPVGKLTVEVAVPKSGQAIIKEVFLDGRPFREAMKDVQ
ncbi:MAG TPA: GDYXXLXY domain-containing protein [Verrucomicrobiota bacterium]|nr:GDYXXLXY domain-containing protein [Verrucomicrobiota bacterium]